MLHTVLTIVARDNGKNIREVPQVFGKTLVDVSHHLILNHELHKLPLITHSSVADVDLPEVPRKVGLIADPEFAGNSEGVGPPKARRSSRWRGGRGGSGAEREAAASDELEVSRGAPAGDGDGGGGGEGGGDGDH